jgi:hypothetical protein
MNKIPCIFPARPGNLASEDEFAQDCLLQERVACEPQDDPFGARYCSRFGSPLVLSRVHWVRPELVAEVKVLTWTDDNLLRQVVYEGLREDKPAAGVRRPVPQSSR